MFEEIANLVLGIIMIGLFILWVRAVAESDGHCHYDDCDHCMYQGDCPEEHK